MKREPAEPQGFIKLTGVGIPRLQAGEDVKTRMGMIPMKNIGANTIRENFVTCTDRALPCTPMLTGQPEQSPSWMSRPGSKPRWGLTSS